MAKFCVHGSNELISNTIRQNGTWEPYETAILTHFLRPGDVFVDVGANIGWYTVAGSIAVGPAGRVFAFEPDAVNLDILCRNIEGAPSVITVVQSAVTGPEEAKAGTGRLYKHSTNWGDHRLDVTVLDAKGREVTEVPLTTLDDALQGVVPNWVKMDIQGSEVRALRGLAGYPETSLMLEFWPNGLKGAGHTIEDLFSELERFACEWRVLQEKPGRGWLQPVTWDDLRTVARQMTDPADERNLTLIGLSERDAEEGA